MSRAGFQGWAVGLASILVLVSTVSSTSPVSAQPGAGGKGEGQVDPSKVRWTHLEYGASKLFVKATTTVDLRHESSAARDLVRLDFDSKAAGRRSSEEIVLDASTGEGVRREKIKHSSGDPYAKLYTYGGVEVHMLRTWPGDIDEATGPRSGWSESSQQAFPRPAAGCDLVLDPAAILYLASARAWQPGGAPFEACVFSSKTFSRLVMTPRGVEQIEVEYETSTTGGGKREVEVLCLEIAARPLDPNAEGDFEVLGLKDDVELFVELSSGLPVRLRGKMDVLGSVTVDLQSARLDVP